MKELESEDRFEMITFNRASTTLFGQHDAGQRGISKAKADAFLKSQSANGGTILRPAADHSLQV